MEAERALVLRTLSYVERVMYKPGKSEEFINKLIAKLRYCQMNEFPNENRAEIVLGKLYFECGEYSKAKVQFFSAIKKNPTIQSSYYGLYKVFVMEGNYERAYENLNKYLELYCKKNPSASTDGFNIIYALMDDVMGTSSTFEVSLDNYLMNEIKDPTLGEMYEKLLENIAKHNYIEAEKLAHQCEQYSREKNNFMEFLVLAKIIRDVLEKNKRIEKNYIKREASRAIEEKDYDTLVYLLQIDSYNDIHNLDFLKYLLVLIDNGYHEEAKEILNNIDSNKVKKKRRTVLRKMIREIEIEEKFTEEQREIYDEALEAIDIDMTEENYEEAFDIASGALYQLDHPIFLYIMGLAAFNLECYSEAISYFNAYNRRGGKYQLDARFYIVCSYNNLGKYERKNVVLKRYERYNLLMRVIDDRSYKDFSYEPFYEQDYHSEKQYRVFKSEEFIKIRDLLIHGQEKEANRILAKLSKKKDKTEEDKLILKYASANKKIYGNINKKA